LFNPLPLPGPTDKIVYDPVDRIIRVHLVSKFLEASYHAGKPEIFQFFVELNFLRNLLQQLKTDPYLKTLVADQIPDLVSFAFSSIQAIEKQYGKESQNYVIAVYMLDEMLVQSINELSAMYAGKLSTEVVFLAPSAYEKLNQNKKVSKSVYDLIKKKVKKATIDSFFPSIYLLNPNDRLDVCSLLQASTTFDVYCPAPSDFDSDEYSEYGFVNQVINNSNNSNTTGTLDAGKYQITLWSSVALILIVWGAVYAMYNMDIGADSMIYRATNIKHTHTQ